MLIVKAGSHRKILKLLDDFSKPESPHMVIINLRYSSMVVKFGLIATWQEQHTIQEPVFTHQHSDFNLAKPLETKCEFRVKKYDQLGRINGDSLWTIFD